jgi:hypothetical protein
MDQSPQRLTAEPQLNEFFVAALQYIDPRLDGHSTLEEVEAAALRRQQALASLPAAVADADLRQLEEALAFIRRSYRRCHGTGDEPCTEADTPAVLPAPEPEAVQAEHVASTPEVVAFDRIDDYAPQPEAIAEPNGSAGTNGHSMPEPPALEAVAEPEVLSIFESATIAEPEVPLTFARRRRSPLSSLWDEDAEPGPESTLLPEQRVLPFVGGLLLLAFQAWLAVFAGVVATRFVAWPSEALGYDVSQWGALGLVALGLAAAAVTAWLAWSYRLRTRRTLMLVNAAAVLVGLDLLAWYLASRNSLPVIDPPGFAPWVLLVAGWGLAAALAYMRDLREV